MDIFRTVHTGFNKYVFFFLIFQMRLSIHMVVAALSLWFALAAGARASLSRTKQPRATRGFKNTEMMTARGFGKRGLVLHGQESVNGEV